MDGKRYYSGSSRSTTWRQKKRHASGKCKTSRRICRLCPPSDETSHASAISADLDSHQGPSANDSIQIASDEGDDSSSGHGFQRFQDDSSSSSSDESVDYASNTSATSAMQCDNASQLTSEERDPKSQECASDMLADEIRGFPDSESIVCSLHSSISSDGSQISGEFSSSEYDSNTSASDLDLDKTCIAYFLEADPLEEGEVAIPPSPPQINDPDDDPDDPPSSSGESDGDELQDSSSESDEGALNVPNFHNNGLDIPLRMHNDFTKGEMILLYVALAVRHNWTFETLLDVFRNLNLTFGPKFFPISKKKLWSSIQLDVAGMRAHVYCGRKSCGQYIGRKNRVGPRVECQCGYSAPVSKARFFITLNFPKQLERFLSIPGMWDKLQYRQRREKASQTSIEDIFDGTLYTRLQENDGPLSSPYNFSYVFNLDGCQPSKKGILKVWPVFARLNELPPEMRQNSTFLVAIYVDKWDPNFNSLLKPFVKYANFLSTTGVRWKPDGINEVVSHFIPICHCVDSDARYKILNMCKHSSYYGCTLCTNQGVHLAGSMRFILGDHPHIGEYEERTHASMLVAMQDAHQQQQNVRGHKGLTQLMLLLHHDLREGQASDDLHPDHEGCSADLTDLMLTVATRTVEGMPTVELLHRIDERLLPIKTPSRIARKPRSITSRGSYKGTELRNWLLFYGVPCLSGLIADEYMELFSLLSYGIFLLSQDVMEPGDIDTASRILRRYALLFEEKFGFERVKYNHHLTTCHKADSVRRLGPPWAYSTYNFESLNGKLLKNVKSPKGAILQIVTRFLMFSSVHGLLYDEALRDTVKHRLKEILIPDRLHGALEVGPHLYVVGRATPRNLTDVERDVLQREGHRHVLVVDEYPGILCGSTRYKSVAAQDQEIKSDDSFLYTTEDTYCTIQNVILFRNNVGHEECGLFVSEHEVARVLPIASHISVLSNEDRDLFYYIDIRKIRSPAIKIIVDGVVHVVALPNCLEID